MTRFIAIDVETANPDMSSICSIGAATFEDGKLAGEWSSLINPHDWFHPINVAIHGIGEEDVEDARTFPEALGELYELLDDSVVVTHTHFDRVAIAQAARRWGVDAPRCVFLDSARVARRTWSQFSRRGYGLENVCNLIGYDFEHHDALEDAKAAGHVIVAAMEITGLDLPGILKRSTAAIDSKNSDQRREGNPEGVLFGETIVFTGALTLVRSHAADLAASAGCNVGQGVTKKTTILVAGDTDIRRPAGHGKSSKHRKAENLIERGVPIRIMGETDFLAMVTGE